MESKNRWGQPQTAPQKHSLLTLGMAVLTVIQWSLLVLRGLGVMDWPWYWVLLPVWIVPVGFVAAVGAWMLGQLVKNLFTPIKQRNANRSYPNT